MSQTITLTLKKSTKGTHVYENETVGISGIYVPKDLLPANAPTTIGLVLPDLGAAKKASTNDTDPDRL